MQLTGYIEINIIAFVILLIIYLNIRNSSERYLYDQKLFLSIVGAEALILIVDTSMAFLNGHGGTAARYANTISTLVYFVLNPVPYMLWSVYADYQINKNQNRLKQLFVTFSAPLYINAVLAVLSPFFRLLFYIDKANVYHKSRFYPGMMFISFFYVVFTSVMIVKQRNKISRKQYRSLLAFAFPPVAGATIQSFLHGAALSWISMSISLLIIFIDIQNNQLHTDYLTGLYNRRQLDSFLAQRIKNFSSGNMLAGIMIDLNSFKRINDVYGHTAGDQALESVGKILKKSFRKEDIIARYGGDEFVILLEINNSHDLTNAINRLKENTKKYNEKNALPFEISLSMGADIFEYRSGMTMQQFFRHIDELMYLDKNGKGL